MSKVRFIVLSLALFLLSLVGFSFSQDVNIYYDNWIDHNKNGKQDPYEDPSLSVEKRITDLLNRMTVEEKTCQLATLYGYGNVLADELPTDEWTNRVWKDGIANIDEHLNGEGPQVWFYKNEGKSVPTQTQYDWPPSKHAEAINEVQRFFIEKTRLGIPIDFTNEGIHGLRQTGATSFPVPPGLASTWDVNLINKIGHVTGKEAKAFGYTNVYAPICDLARDPRWGRVIETFGEDPYLASKLATAMTLGIQEEGVVSTLKHFAVYSIPKGGRDGDVRTDPQATIREVDSIHLEPFRRAIIDGGALGVMSSYNDYNGVPVTGSSKFLTEILRNSWGFQGYVVSDSEAVEQIWNKHHVAEDLEHAVTEAVQAGLNVWTNFREPEDYIEPLRNAIKSDLLSMDVIDERVRDVLRVKYILGLFDKPYVENIDEVDKIVHSEEHQQVALEAARKSIVLLKNENSLLPLNNNIKKILVVGPLADDTKNLSTGYGPITDIETVYEAIKKKVGDKVAVTYSRGCEVIDKNFPESEILPEKPDAEEQKMIDEAVEKANDTDVIIAVIGENDRIIGEGYTRSSLDLAGHQLDLVKALFATGKPVVVVLLNGRPITINWINENIPAIVEGWFPGEKSAQAIAEVLFGDYNPGGKLPLTFPKSVGQIPFNFPYKPSSQVGGSTYVSGALYPFGYGLSYTEFKYDNLQVTPKQIDENGMVTVSVEVSNIGKVKGDEVVQVYINDKVSSVTTYDKELKGFYRVTLFPGQTKRISFYIPASQLSLLNRDMEKVVEPGEFEVMVGSSSEDIRLKDSFGVVGD